MREAEAHFLGLRGWWPDGAPLELQTTMDDEGRSQGLSIATRETAEASCTINQGRTLTVGTTWATTGSWDDRSLIAPLMFRAEKARPTDAFALLRPLLQVQGLLSLAHDGFVRARTGHARVDVEPRPDGRQDPRSSLWVGSLMVPYPTVVETETFHEPLFTYATVRGIAGIGRWCRLSDLHPRAFSPVVDRHHSGMTSLSVAVREIADGIEYWVNSHRHRTWGAYRRSTKGDERSHARSLAEHVGRPFDTWVGNNKRWAAEFTRTNNLLKHDPSYQPDLQAMADLAESGRMLLAAALLNRVARTKAPARRMFRHYSLAGIGERVRDLVE